MSNTRAALTGATIGVVTAAAGSLRPSLTPRSRLHQGLVTAMMSTTGAATGAAAGALAGRIAGSSSRGFWLPAIAVAATTAFSAVRGFRFATSQADAHPEWGPQESEPILGAALGSAAAGGLATGAALVARELGDGGRAMADRVGGDPLVWSGLGGAAAAGVTGTAGTVTFRQVLGRLSAAGRAPDKALERAIDDPCVSGGPGSAVPYDTLSREGRRYVHWRVRIADLREAGLSDGQDSVRVFVGVDSAPSITERVDLAMAELERLEAFDKSALIIGSPAGSGYANSVPVEALEFFRAGDCASVVVQYGVLPSMFSNGKVPIAAQTFRALVDRIHERISDQGTRPLVFAYGESLGARAAEVGLMLDPPLVDLATARMSKVDAALFVGTPGGKSLRDELLHHPATVHVDRWQNLPERLPTDVQLWFLEHDADPVTRFRGNLIWKRPAWLDSGPRGRNIPEAMTWRPLATWQQVLLDVAYATQAQSGVFRSVGHDYRADLAPVVAAAFAPGARGIVDQVQELLAEREVTRDRMLAAAEGASVAPAPSASSEPTT